MKHAVNHLKKSDPVLGAIIRGIGAYSMEQRDPVFATLVRSIVFQQVSTAVARIIYGRVEKSMPSGVTPEAVLRKRATTLRKLGLSQQKPEYIRDLARHTKSGTVDFAALSNLSDEQVIETLTQVKGIGVWTAQMFLMFALARPNVLPTGDFGIRKAMQIAYKLNELPKPQVMEEIAKPWRPYCSVASWYLWRSLDGIAGI
ncbi:MAG: DNA-3-methyladenine glycosylase 2 family protein [Candidatus Solibacter usitatus]|nr:DNA-3-methyladenine glycosylase 2 family protein [Candidatus Solibacter usitatus]